MVTAHSITTAEVTAPLKSVKDTATIIKAVEVLSPLDAMVFSYAISTKYQKFEMI